MSLMELMADVIFSRDFPAISAFSTASPAVSMPEFIALTASFAPPCSFWIILLISSVLSCVLLARVRTSSATTAKPRPCSPARAASIAAFKASKLVCSEMPLMTSRTVLISPTSSARVWMTLEALCTFS